MSETLPGASSWRKRDLGWRPEEVVSVIQVSSSVLLLQVAHLRTLGPFIRLPFFKKFIYFIYLFLAAFLVFVAARGLSLVVASRGYSSLRCAGFSLWWLLLLRSTGSRHVGFSSCGMQAQ